MAPLKHRPIPVLPDRPRVQAVAGHITRSYTAGRQHFSRAVHGESITVMITSDDKLPSNVSARLMMNRHANGNSNWQQAPFTWADDKSLTCSITPELPGLHSFRTEYSPDNGFTWVQDTVPDAWVLVDPAQADGVRLYTMIPAISGNIDDWKDDLKRISEMGFNAIHLLPVTSQDTSQSPYSARDLFSIEPAYLPHNSTEDGLPQIEEFIEAAKAAKMRLCFDLVLNHVGVNSRMARQAPDWIVPDQNRPDGLMRARYWFVDGWQSWEDLVLINYEHPSEKVRSEIWSYMTDYALFWAKYANDTGGFVRLDNLHGSDPKFMKALTLELRSEYPEVALLAEYFTDEQTIINTVPEWGLNLLLATPWEHRYVPDLREHLKYLLRVSGQIRYYSPITSHDSGAPAQEFGSVNSTIPRYVCAALLGTGATGIVQGVEFGEKAKIEFIGRQLRTTYPPVALFGDFIAEVNSVLAENPAFRNGANCKFVDNGHDAVIAAFRQDETDEHYGFLVVCNFDITGQQSITIDLAPFLDGIGPYRYIELLTNRARTIGNPILELQLAACATQVLKFIKSD